MVLGQNPVKKHSKQRSSKDARKHDATDNRRAHQLFSSEPRLPSVIDSELPRPRAPEIGIQQRESNTLLATGAATRSMKAPRVCGSLRRKFTASCSLCDFGGPLSCHNCSHDEFWYFCTTLLATLSNNGCCCALATPRKSSTGRDTRTRRFSFD